MNYICQRRANQNEVQKCVLGVTHGTEGRMGNNRVCRAMAEIHSSIDIWSDRHGIQSVRPGISIAFGSVFQLLFHSKSVLLRGKMYL